MPTPPMVTVSPHTYRRHRRRRRHGLHARRHLRRDRGAIDHHRRIPRRARHSGPSGGRDRRGAGRHGHRDLGLRLLRHGGGLVDDCLGLNRAILRRGQRGEADIRCRRRDGLHAAAQGRGGVRGVGEEEEGSAHQAQPKENRGAPHGLLVWIGCVMSCGVDLDWGVCVCWCVVRDEAEHQHDA
jgi:hypothetical protein